MPRTRWLVLTGALAAGVLAAGVLAVVLLTTGATAGSAHGGAATPAAGTPGVRRPGTTTVRATVRARLPVVAGLTAVSCPSPRLCMTVGSTPSHGTVVLRWNGRSWADVSAPGSLSAIWCGSATRCLAVGNTRRNASGGRGALLAAEWHGHTWTVVPMPSPAHAFGPTLTGVDCASATTCTAVGSYSTARSGYDPPTYALAENWNGTAWRLEPAAAKGTMLSSVSCPAAGACTAVGTTTSGGLVAERWNGTAWAGQRTEPSGGGGPGEFSAVSCPSASNCTAVGDSGGDDNQGLTETWNGTSWGAQDFVAPADGSMLSGVTCLSGTDCLAVGSDGGVHGNVTLAAWWHGGSWPVQRTPNVPRPALDSTFGAVSCASPTACLAVGSSDEACCTAGGYSKHDRALAAWWNGRKWRMLPTPSGG